MTFLCLEGLLTINVYCRHSPRAISFCAKDTGKLVEWIKTIGLEMYCDLFEDKHLSGENLTDLVAEKSYQPLVVRIESLGPCPSTFA